MTLHFGNQDGGYLCTEAMSESGAAGGHRQRVFGTSFKESLVFAKVPHHF